MLKIAKDLNSVISGLEDIGKYVEARELHNVFIKVSQIPGGVGAGMAAVATGNVGTGVGMIAGNAIAGNAIAGNANNPSGNFQKLIEDYKNYFINERKTTNNANAPGSTQFYNTVLRGNSLTEPEKLAFRAQAYRIRTEVRNQTYGMGDTSNIGNQGNINLIVENAVKVSGLYNERKAANLDRYFTSIMSIIEKQIIPRISQKDVPKYLESAKALVGTYINRQKAVLQNSAMQPR